MAKILISSIGTGSRNGGYNVAKYEIDKKIYENEKFIAKALCEHLKIDKLFLVGTQKSIWEAVFEEFEGDEQNAIKIYEAKENNNLIEFIPQIEAVIDKRLGTNGSKCFIIEYGKDENELWGNFDKFLQISTHLEPNDEIHLDITHSFRSLSLMSFIMSEFISNASGRELNIQGVYYGMLEYSGENNGITPIVNLAIFFKLLRWSKAIRELKTYGNAKEILTLLKQDEGKKANRFENFTNALSMSDIVSLKSATSNLKTEISFFKESKNKIYNLISDDLEKFIKMLDVDSLSLLQYRMAKWYCENQNYALSYVMLSEAVISAVAEENGLDAKDQDERQEAKNILKNRKNSFKKSHAKDDISETYYDKVVPIRNYIAHALDKDSRRTNIDVKQAVDNLPLYIEKLKSLFKGKN
jgi:CRISPR-associated protein, TM1812 family